MSKHVVIGPVVAGVDGSESARRAVRWAAKQAQQRGVGLRLVHAVELPFRQPSGVMEEQSVREVLSAQGARWLDETRAVAVETVPDVPVELVSSSASAAELLIKESAAASLVVLGSRGLGGFSGLLIGSTAIAVASRAECPMVVVCGSGPVPTAGPVIVGVDGTATSDDAVAFAFAQASLCGADLVAVHSWTETEINSAFAVGAFVMDDDLLAAEADKILAERLAGWQERYPRVSVTTSVVHDSPARALLARSATARLVVVGCRGRGGFSGLVLGSTSQQLLHHSTCPVAVVRPTHG